MEYIVGFYLGVIHHPTPGRRRRFARHRQIQANKKTIARTDTPRQEITHTISCPSFVLSVVVLDNAKPSGPT